MEKKFYDKNFKLGVLGGGQLGRMLIQEAINWNVFVKVLDPAKDAPCSQIANEFVCGDFNDFQTVVDFGKDVDILTIEFEHVNTNALKFLVKNGKKVFPQPELIELIQDKGLQKDFYSQNDIPSSPFQLVKNKQELLDLKKPFPYVLKLRKGGYDGKGVMVIKNENDLKQAFDSPCVVEDMVTIDKEISVIVARNIDGSIKSFPVVELVFNQTANLVDFLISPANISVNLENKAREIAENLIQKLNLVGLLAVEMFVDSHQNILVNEIAPRTHNSGHQSIEGNVTSQFEQHLRAILSLPLGDTSIIQPSVMVNILGEPNFSGKSNYEGFEELLTEKGVFIHLYGKTDTKPYRKMGHFTVINTSQELALEKANMLKNKLRVIA